MKIKIKKIYRCKTHNKIGYGKLPCRKISFEKGNACVYYKIGARTIENNQFKLFHVEP